MPSGRKPLAAARTARGDDPAAALRRHARAKAVSALAHELARLIGAFHVSISGTRAAYRGRKPRPSMRGGGFRIHAFAAKFGFPWFDDPGSGAHVSVCPIVARASPRELIGCHRNRVKP